MNMGALVLRIAERFSSGPYVEADRIPESVFPSAKNPANPYFGHAPLICCQPAVHQFFDPYDSQPFVFFLKKSCFRELLDEAECAHYGNTGRFRQLRSALVASARCREIAFRNAWRQENLEHPLIQVGKELRRRHAMGR